MKHLFLTALLGLSLVMPAQAKIIDIKSIAGKTPAQVEKILGKPEAIEKVSPANTGCHPCPKMRYKKGKYEIVYIKGVADWIAVTQLGQYGLKASLLSEFALPAKPPSAQNADAMRWTQLPGLLSVTLFGFEGRADYLYIKVKTP